MSALRVVERAVRADALLPRDVIVREDGRRLAVLSAKVGWFVNVEFDDGERTAFATTELVSVEREEVM